MKKILLGLVLIASSTTNAQSVTPEVTASAGAHFAIPTLQISWTLGEPITSTLTNSSAQLTQGFQQSTISLVGISDYDLSYSVEAFPNPSADVVRIRLSENVSEGSLNLIDPTGKIVLMQDITESEFQLDFSPYAQGIYLLNLMDENGTLLHAVRLQKIN
ncbi:MAG: T9SS type A sorting domain-containing protein [Crocinitomicaceae bacterium]